MMYKTVRTIYLKHEFEAAVEFVTKHNRNNFHRTYVADSLLAMVNYVHSLLIQGKDVSYSGTMGYVVHVADTDETDYEKIYYLSILVDPSLGEENNWFTNVEIVTYAES